MSKPGYPFPGLTVERVCGILTELVEVERHRFWADSISILDEKRFNLTATAPKPLTGLYLVSLAVAAGGRLVTFDRTILWRSIRSAKAEGLLVLSGN